MSVDPVSNIAASAAGSAYAQSASAKACKSDGPARKHAPKACADRLTSETADREGDGRQPWILPLRDARDATENESDAGGPVGNRVDLVG